MRLLWYHVTLYSVVRVEDDADYGGITLRTYGAYMVLDLGHYAIRLAQVIQSHVTEHLHLVHAAL